MNKHCKCGGRMIPNGSYYRKVLLIKELKNHRPMHLRDAKDIVDAFLKEHPTFERVFTMRCNICGVSHRQKVRYGKKDLQAWLRILTNNDTFSIPARDL